MTRSPVLDPFMVFGVDHSLDLDDRQLELRYLQLSRECHPDLHRAKGTADCAAVLARSAEINDSWRILRDRWERARALIDVRAPGAMDRQKQLDPEFLGSALELAEEVAFAEPDAVPELRTRLRAEATAAWQRLLEAARADDWEGAARCLHESKYARKALADLQARAEEHPA